MTKNIVLLSDGTGNAASSPHKTNVWRMYKALDLVSTTNQKSKQLAFYDDGVGTSTFVIKRLLGQITGWGLKKNVKELYANLCRVYQPGDKIFIFGFSRGAFTARVLASLIGDQGIIKSFESEVELQNYIERAYDDFRHENFVPSLLSAPRWIYRWFKNPKNPDKKNTAKRYVFNKGEAPLIDLIGVWDTVDAYGAPIDELMRGWDMVVWPLTAKDRKLSPAVGSAFHALALDEQRESFEPMLWNEDTVSQTGLVRDDRIDQVWFAGVHSNLGGGYPDDSLAHVSLNWMIKKSEKLGLIFDKERKCEYSAAADIHGPIYNNRSGLGNAYRYAPRKVEALCRSDKPGIFNGIAKTIFGKNVEQNSVRIDLPRIHHSVFDRIREGGDSYAPINLPERYSIITETGELLQQQNAPPKIRNIESTGQAESRRILQSEVWNKVWGLKVLYYLTLLFTALYVVAPYYLTVGSNGVANNEAKRLQEVQQWADPFFGTFSDVFRAIPEYIGKIPGLGLLESWALLYGNFPYVFLGGLLTIIAAVGFANFIAFRLNSEMRTDWSHITGQGTAWADQEAARSSLANFLDSYRKVSEEENTLHVSLADSGARILRIGGEILAALLFLLLVLLLLWRVIFTALDGFGGICASTDGKDTANWSAEFDPKNECLDTKINLEKGQKYQLTFKIENDWNDKTIKSDVHGWIGPSGFLVHFATPLRRHLFKRWYQPIGRIGNSRYDRYTAETPDEWPQAGRILELKMKFTARQSGRLYVYLNDAVAPWPFSDPWIFYKNNEGSKAKLKVVPINGD